MTNIIYFSTTTEICTALGQYADARATNDKDLILTATKIDGRETLTTVRKSTLRWYQRLIRYFGFGSSSLSAVARVLQENEPCLPRRMSEIDAHYGSIDAVRLRSLSKGEYKALQRDKARGSECFKDTLSRYNNTHRFGKTYLYLKEYEKVDLLTHPTSPFGAIRGDNSTLHKYKAPCLDPNKFCFLAPDMREVDTLVDFTRLGFCYEYGLGVEKSEKLALELYELAKKQDHVARFNFSRLRLLTNSKDEEARKDLTELKAIVQTEKNMLVDTIREHAEKRQSLPQELIRKAIDHSLQNMEQKQKYLTKLMTKIEAAL